VPVRRRFLKLNFVPLPHVLGLTGLAMANGKWQIRLIDVRNVVKEINFSIWHFALILP